MKQKTKQLYFKHRKKGERAYMALSCAKTEAQWNALEYAGFVRLVWIPDEECYDDSYIDTWNESQELRERARKELWEQIEQDGVWILSGEFRTNTDEPWESGDCICGLVGQDTDYETDVMQNTIDVLRNALKLRSETK